MHPGNAFVTADGRIAPVDFGIMGRLDERAREDLADLLAALLNGDYHRLASLMIAVGWVPAKHEPAVLAQACRAVAAPFWVSRWRQCRSAPCLARSSASRGGSTCARSRNCYCCKPWWSPRGLAAALTPASTSGPRRAPISAWMIEHRGPAARVAKTAAALTRLVDHLPRWVDRLERAAQATEAETADTAQGEAGAPVARAAWLWAAICSPGWR